MSSYDKATITFPDSTSYTFYERVEVTDTFEPKWAVSGGSNPLALADQIPGVGDSNNAEQAYFGVGGIVRSFTVRGAVGEDLNEDWGDTAKSDDVITKLNDLGNTLDTVRVASDVPATLEYGGFSTDGQYSPITVVPGKIELPAELAENPSAVTVTTNWLASIDAGAAAHQLNPFG